jgi:ferredoxin
MRIVLDSDRCQGHVRCIVAASDLFDSDELGFGVVIGDGIVPAHREEAARLAMSNCPERAITLVD